MKILPVMAAREEIRAAIRAYCGDSLLPTDDTAGFLIPGNGDPALYKYCR